jgi:two-component system OmpR family sensor kinase
MSLVGRLWPVGLRWRLTAGTVGLILVLLVSVGTVQYFALRAYLLSELSRNLNNQARYAVHAMGVKARSNPSALAHEATDQTVRAAVFDIEGHQLALGSSTLNGLPWVDPPLDQLGVSGGQLDTEGRYAIVHAGRKQLLVVAAPVGPPWVASEVLIMESSLDATSSTLRTDLASYLLGGAVALTVGAVLTALLTGQALSGLRKVAQTATAIAEGDLDRRAAIAGRDEVAALGAAFDEMVGRLQQEMTRQRESEEAMRRFLADASHELRTPIAMLRGNVEVLRRGAASNPDDLAVSLQDMHRATLRMSRLVDDLLTLARIDQGRQLRMVDVDLPELLQEAVRTGSQIARGHPVVLETADAVRVRADPDAFGRVLVNLIDNAAKYSPPDGPVTLRGLATDAAVRIEVSDQGPGIPPEDQERIFQRFYRGSSKGPRQADGAGLGLAISAALVKRHGGSITVDSTPGAGSTFAIVLPRAQPGLGTRGGPAEGPRARPTAAGQPRPPASESVRAGGPSR